MSRTIRKARTVYARAFVAIARPGDSRHRAAVYAGHALNAARFYNRLRRRGLHVRSVREVPIRDSRLWSIE